MKLNLINCLISWLKLQSKTKHLEIKLSSKRLLLRVFILIYLKKLQPMLLINDCDYIKSIFDTIMVDLRPTAISRIGKTADNPWSIKLTLPEATDIISVIKLKLVYMALLLLKVFKSFRIIQ